MPMTGTVSSPDWRREALAAAEHCRLPFGRQSWRGTQGNWLGAGLGSSIDFQDHRAYAPGDDPRYIHWAAYARTGQLTMKLYRAESAPLVDIAIDVSASMAMTRRKEERLDALLAFCVESADRAAAPVRIHAAAIPRRCWRRWQSAMAFHSFLSPLWLRRRKSPSAATWS
jgi:uncharacterized protein (DUF58 family)